MDIVLTIADYILKIGGALSILLLIGILLYILRLLFFAKGMLGGVKKSIESVEQSIMMPFGFLSQLFGPIDPDTTDKEKF